MKTAFIQSRRLCFLIISLGFLLLNGIRAKGQNPIPETPILKTADVAKLFLLKEGESLTLSLYDRDQKATEFTGKVMGHQNRGTETGVLNILLSGTPQNIKLLISRKNLNGQLIYRTTMIDKNADSWYSGNSQNKGEIILTKKAQNQIVTD
jgi:hypothetical protein